MLLLWLVGRGTALWACLAAAVSQSWLAACAGWNLFGNCAQLCMGMGIILTYLRDPAFRPGPVC